MSFTWPVMLLSLLLIPLLVGMYARLHQRRRIFLKNFTQFGGLLSDNPMGKRRHFPALLFLVGLSLLFIGLARPQATLSLPRIEGTVILTFDVSGSMAANDLKPMRMEAAKAAAREFVENQPASILIGVVAFSDSGFSIQPPTKDKEAIYVAINRLSPERGTSLAQGILAALNVVAPILEEGISDNPNLPPISTPTPVPPGTFIPAVIVLLTDGDNNMEPDPLEVALEARRRGVRIDTVGIGSPEGTTLTIDDFLVYTQLNETILQQIAQATQGTYYNAQNEGDLRAIYEELKPQLVVKTEEIEVTSLFAGTSLLLFLLGGIFSMIWFGRLL
jgi:Ca-activated chloride channel family protein